jgi:ribosomal-protein-alanine N-acetyltransferase
MAWIRLFAVSSKWSAAAAWQMLWPEAQTQLCLNPGTNIASIPLQEWYQSLLVKSHFRHAYDVILLAWQPGIRRPIQKDLPFVIRSMTYDDLPTVQAVDELAFEPLWQNSVESLKYAFRQAAVATVAEDSSGFLGYQISTASPMGGHLARLAVHPRSQNKGIGYALLCDLLDQFERRGAARVTVNTQQHNLASLALYNKAGFQQTGEVYPVYQYT